MIQTDDELHALERHWEMLWREDPGATPFQSPQWLLPWWHQFGEELRAVSVSDGGRLVGLLPFYLYREPGGGERRLLPIGVGTSDYLGGVFSPACSSEDVKAALEFLLDEPGWDTLYLSQLRSESRILAALRALTTESGVHVFAGVASAYRAATDSSGLPQKIRRNSVYYENRAKRRGVLELSSADEGSWPEIFDALVAQHTERWNARGVAGALSDERILACHREVLPRLLQAQMLRCNALRLNGEIVAVLYALVDPPWRPQRTQYFYLESYSPAHRELSPGTLLLAQSMTRAAAEGIQTIDMLRGDEDYKKLWHLERKPTYGCVVRARDHQNSSSQTSETLALTSQSTRG